MLILVSIAAAELLALLHFGMVIDGRRPVPSMWHRNDLLFALVGGAAVSLLIASIAALAAAIMQGMPHGTDMVFALAALLSIPVIAPVIGRLRARSRSELASSPTSAGPTPLPV